MTLPMRSAPGSNGTARRPNPWTQALAGVVTAALVLFHLLLLWQRVLDQTLFEPVPALRWLATLVVVLALYRLHRRGLSLVRGRGALVFWLLVLLLHASFWGPLAEAQTRDDSLSGQALLLALPAIGVSLGMVWSAMRRILTRLFGLVRPAADRLIAVLDLERQALPDGGPLPILACRPPPSV